MDLIIGYIKTFNTNDNFYNLVVLDDLNNEFNIKALQEQFNELEINRIYKFNVQTLTKGDRTVHVLDNFIDVSKIDTEERDIILRKFLKHEDTTFFEYKDIIFTYINKIDNPILKEVTSDIIKDNLVDLLTYPGGKSVHHSYLGGLVSHIIGMLKIADSLINIYSYLDKNYIYAGILLHDIGKIIEFSDIQNIQYSIDGNLLGHLVIGALILNEYAVKLGYKNTEEIRLLEHILISHHGQLEYGAAKRPQTAEALIVWQCDLIDSKFSVIGERLNEINEGEFTDSLYVLEKTRIYKPKKNK